ncbi:hypothetical protein AWZ03_011306 [Drosophila navojoa]|uniref:SKP1 component POZ domain-containing protein n=1 Tax=Drosophila navojoa TaxID=7232 RepID=A0A484B082_DRONA|nr:hypothetical protein AWZ03_011306 [Drosophila navojoa]
MERIKLESSEGEIFETDVQTAKCSMVLKTMLEDCCLDKADDSVVSLSNVSSNTLRYVLFWAEHHKNDDPPTDDDAMPEPAAGSISPWDMEFISKVDQSMLFQLMLAAHYLDMRGLMDLTCRAVALMINNKSPAEIRQIFNIHPQPLDNGE